MSEPACEAQELLVLNHINQQEHRGTSYRLLRLLQADLFGYKTCHFLFLYTPVIITQMSMQQSINKATSNLMLLFPGDKQDMAQKHRIKNKNQDDFLLTWYGNLTLVLQGALLLQMCCFPHIIPEQKGSIATAWKCRELLAPPQQPHPCVLCKHSVASRCFPHHLLWFWADILILLLCESLPAAYLGILDTSGGLPAWFGQIPCHPELAFSPQQLQVIRTRENTTNYQWNNLCWGTCLAMFKPAWFPVLAAQSLSWSLLRFSTL